MALIPSTLARLSIALLALIVIASCGDDQATGGEDTTTPDTQADTVEADTVAPLDTLDDTLADTPSPDDTVDEEVGDDTAEIADDASGEVVTPYPDHTFVWVNQAQPESVTDEPYLVDEPVKYRTTDVLPDLDVRALALVGDTLWAGTASGLVKLDTATESFVEVPLGDGVTGPVLDIAEVAGPGETLLVLLDTTLASVPLDGGEVTTVSLDTVTPTAVATDGAALWLGTTDGLASLDGGVVTPITEAQGFEVRDVVIGPGEAVWMATGQGVATWAEGALVTLDVASGDLQDDDVRALAMGADGTIWIGTALGVTSYFDGDVTQIPAGIGGLPTGSLTSLYADGDTVLMGHEVGGTAIQGGAALTKVDHYVKGRWLMAPGVTDVAMGPDGTWWYATSGGITEVHFVERTLGDKMTIAQEFLEANCFRVDGFVAPDISVDDPYTPTEYTLYDSDNDGLWTQMQIGAWTYAAAVTGDEQYCALAKKSIDVMLMQIDIPAGDFEAAGMAKGFVTRSLVRDDEGALFDSKASQSNWHLVEWTDGHSYYWKDDTSSDETTGHFYGYPLYYDICATDEEKEIIAEHVGLLASYIVDNGFYLIDLDGEKTTHGHWAPEMYGIAVDGYDTCMENQPDDVGIVEWLELCMGAAYGGGWLNSVEILGHMLAAWHITGDPKFYDAFEELVSVYRYDEVATPTVDTLTITNQSFMNHSDHELAALAYHTLIRYDPDDERRDLWIQGLLFMYEHEAEERNPLWAGFVGLAVAGESQVADAIESLQLMPLDQTNWPTNNEHRLDCNDWGIDRHGDPQWDTVFPYDEIRTVWWNGNLYVKSYGGNLGEQNGPMAYLLPYWALKYSGILE